MPGKLHIAPAGRYFCVAHIAQGSGARNPPGVPGKEDEYVVVEAGSGKYHFSAPYSKSENSASAMK